MFEIEKYWAGTQESFDFVLEAAVKASEMQAARARGDENPWALPPIYQVNDGVAILNVHGPLVNGSAGIMRLFGITGYDDIQSGALEAVQLKDVKSLMLHVSSNGGSVNGCDECSEFLGDLGKLKPILTYAGGPMASAAYWLGSAGQRRLASRTSIVGSLGVITTHVEYSEQMKKEGVKATVLRVGQYKALANSMEPLSDEAKAQIMEMMGAINDIFEERVAANLETTKARVHDKMGQGRVFLGAAAQQVGLVHGICSLQEAFTAAKILGRG